MEQGSSTDNTDGKTANRDTETDLALNARFPATERNRTIVISLPKGKKKKKNYRNRTSFTSDDTLLLQQW